jgi:hypothetical protein
VGGAELPWILEVLNETEGTVRRSPQQAIWLELGLIKVATRPSISSFTELVERVAKLEAALAGGELPQARPAAPARPAPVPPTPVARPAAPAPLPTPTPAPAPAPAPVRTPEPVAEPPVAAAVPTPEPPPSPAAPAAMSETGRAMPPGGPSFKAPEPKPTPTGRGATGPGGAPAATPEPDAAPAPAMAGGLQPLPPGAWDRVRQEVRARSVPTAALLEQQAAIDRWEADGAVVIRIGKAFKETFEKAGQRRKVLGEAIVAVFGAGTFPRLEVGDPKTAGANSPKATAPVRPMPAPASATAAVPAVRPNMPPPPPEDDIPYDEAPPAWLDELEASRPDPEPGAPAVAKPASVGAKAANPGEPKSEAAVSDGAIDDPAIKLAVDLFNGRVVAAPDEA